MSRAGLRGAEADIEQAVFFAVELDALEGFGPAAGRQDLDFLVFKEVVQILARIGAAGRSADDLDDVVDVIERDVVAEQDVLARFGLAQFELRAPAHHFHAVVDEQLQHRNQAQLARLPVDDGQQDHAERFLHLRELVEVVQDDLRFFAALDLDHHAHAFAIGFVAHVGNAFDLFRLHQFGDALDQARFVHLVREFR